MKERLSRRERQIMDLIYGKGQATAEEVRDGLPGEVSNSSVRTQLSILEAKGLLSHHLDGKRFVYSPTVPAQEAGTEALRGVLATYFDNSAAKAVAALLDASDGQLPEEEYQRLAELIRAAGREGP